MITELSTLYSNPGNRVEIIIIGFNGIFAIIVALAIVLLHVTCNKRIRIANL